MNEWFIYDYDIVFQVGVDSPLAPVLKHEWFILLQLWCMAGKWFGTSTYMLSWLVIGILMVCASLVLFTLTMLKIHLLSACCAPAIAAD